MPDFLNHLKLDFLSYSPSFVKWHCKKYSKLSLKKIYKKKHSKRSNTSYYNYLFVLLTLHRVSVKNVTEGNIFSGIPNGKYFSLLLQKIKAVNIEIPSIL